MIGENGAGKSTLLNILYGRYRQDAGRIFLHEEEVTEALHSPSDAIRRGLGLVSQHYALIPALSVVENVILGSEPTLPGGVLNLRQAAERIAALAQQLGLHDLDLHTRAERLSVAAQQKVEILKALYRKAQILLLDEPTATLAPQEADSLFALLHQLIDQGNTIVFVTHKLQEVMAHSDAVTVLRAGQNVGDFRTSETQEQELLRYMIGASTHSPAHLHKPLIVPQEETEPNPSTTQLPNYLVPQSPNPLLQIEDITVRNVRRAVAVAKVSLTLQLGEIVGIAGVDGSGQRELAEALVGLRPMDSGRLFLTGLEITHQSVRQRQELGMAYIPEDRHRSGLILDFTVAENFLLGHEHDPFWGGGKRLHPSTLLTRTASLIQSYGVRTAQEGANLRIRTLSGGNQQKVVIARAMESHPSVLVACQPTRGLDVEASRFVYKILRDAREKGLGVLLFSLDLDEILELSDRVAVMFNGCINGILSRTEATPEQIGRYMVGSQASSPN